MKTDLSPAHVDKQPAAPLPRVCRPLFLVPFLLSQHFLSGQSIINGSFSGGGTGWTGCGHDIGVAVLYGGSSFTDKVAAVNGGILSSLSDDNLLCQTISSLIPGTVYQVSFQATRCPLPLTPASVSVSVVVDGNALEAVVSRTGSWNMSTTAFSFVATSTSHTLTISPNVTGGLGMIIDNVAIDVLSPLPIALLDVHAHAVNGAVQIDWSTASEDGNVLFTVERSADLDTWSEVAQVEGAGMSTTVLHYTALDAFPLQGVSYYRLRQTDADGGSGVSQVCSVTLASDASWRIWPNPVHARATLHVDEGTRGTLPVFDAIGRTIGALVVGEDRQGELNVDGWAPGLYRVRSERSGKCAAFTVE